MAKNKPESTASFPTRKNGSQLSKKLDSVSSKLEKKELYHEAIFAHSPVGLASTDSQGRFNEVNPALCDLLGRSSEELLSMTISDITPKKYAAIDTMHEEILFRSQCCGPYEKAYFHKNGQIIQVRQHCNLLEHEDGTTVLICMEDITPMERREKKLRESEKKFRGLYDSIRDGIVHTDLDGAILDANPAFCRMLDFDLDELRQSTLFDITPVHWHEYQHKTLSAIRKEKHKHISKEYRKKDGSHVPVTAHGWLTYDDQHMPSGMWALVRDMTESRRMEDRLSATRERYRSLVETLPHAIVIIQDRTIVFANTGAAAMFGHNSPEDLIGLDPLTHVLITEKEKVAMLMMRQIRRPDDAPAHFETTLMDIKGSPFPAELYLRDIPGQEGALQAVILDITERKAHEKQLTRQAFYDALTGMPNRALLMNRLDQALNRERSKGDIYALLFLDMDRFRTINETLGHGAGDNILIMLAERIKRCVRSLDTVARMGSDEFAVLLEDLDSHRHAVRIAKSISMAVEEPFFIEGHEVHTHLHIGMVLSPTAYEKPQDVLRNAEIALNRARRRGKPALKVFNSRMHDEAVSLLKRENALRKAVRNQEFVIHYQSIHNLKTRSLYGVEALVRWQRPGRGLVPPGEFITLAEDTGLIIPMGQWVLERACSFMAELQKENPLVEGKIINVNLSAKQFLQPDLVDMVGHTIRESGINPESLNMEITESVVMEDAAEAIHKLKRLKDLGCRLSVDDFGTGYSSLSYLQKFPLDTLKVDRSFVTDIGRNQENFEIVRAIVLLAKSLGMTVVAEGVEDEIQAMMLTQLQCEYGQGYHFSRPMTRRDVSEMLTADAAADPAMAEMPVSIN